MIGQQTLLRWITYSVIIALVICLSFVAGRYFEHFPNGHWYEVRHQQDYETNHGHLHLLYVTDTHGIPSLDPGDFVISLQSTSGYDIKLYQAKRGFQESTPIVDKVDIDGDQLKWTDGLYRYTLLLERIEPNHKP